VRARRRPAATAAETAPLSPEEQRRLAQLMGEASSAAAHRHPR